MSTTDTPEAQPPTWDDALAHAEVLREQGVKVSINEHWMSIEIFGTNGKYHDPDDGTPAYQAFYRDGKPKVIGHFANGKYNDPDDGTPAYQDFYRDGTTEWISHWTNGKRHDPADGIPARQDFYSDGSQKVVEHWTNGRLVSEERFPPEG